MTTPEKKLNYFKISHFMSLRLMVSIFKIPTSPLLQLTTLLITLFSSSATFAMFCPGNFNQIDLGDSFAIVEAQCGKPASQKNTKEEDMSTPQEWTYYATMPTDPLTSVGSVKITVAFSEGKVINISSGGYSVGATTLCNGNSIQVGSTMKQVITACGKSSMINKSDPDPGSPTSKGNEIVEWQYNSTPPITLKFTNGRLSARE